MSRTPVRYAAIRTLRTWLWLIGAVAAVAGGVTGFAIVFDGVDDEYAITASGAAVIGAILVATPYLVVIAFLSLILEIAEGVAWIGYDYPTTGSKRRKSPRRSAYHSPTISLNLHVTPKGR